MKDKRIGFLDAAKCILIWLVVLGHIFERYMVEGSMQMSAFNFIFSFAMPAFIIISGYFTNADRPLKGLPKLFETYIVFQLLHAVVDFDFSLVRLIFYPKWTMWYLMSLIWWKVALYILNRYSKKKLFIVVAILLSELAPYIKIPVYLLAIERSISYFPFFLIGVLMRDFDVERIRQIKTIRAASLVIIIISIVASLHNPIETRWLFNWNSLYYDMPITLSVAPLVRIIAIIGCSIIATSVIILTPENFTLLRQEGKNSLFYYMWHSILLTIIFAFIQYFHISIGFIGCLGLWFALIILLMLMTQIKFFPILLTPYTYYKANF